MRMLTHPWILAVAFGPLAPVAAQDAPESPRIDSVVIAEPQPHERDPAVIWYDDFDEPAGESRYPEQGGMTTDEMRFGAAGRSLRMHYRKGERGTGGRKVFFGDTPTYRSKAVRTDESFTDVYWRIYVKHPHDWTGGGPAKLSRATSIVPPGWRQAMISHVWSSGDALTLDPASGVRGNRVVTTRYNDFSNLRWLGNRPTSEFKLHGADGAGWWVCVESRARLNTPGKADGLAELWIDGRLEAERKNLDWRGSFDDRGINAVFLESYWNQGSPVDQSRWIDNFVISTDPIGPVVCSRNPTLIRTPYRGAGRVEWEAELAQGADGETVVWRSDSCGDVDRIDVTGDEGQFTGPLEGMDRLEAAERYYCRVRQRIDGGRWSGWSPWHQPLRTDE